MRHFVTRAVQRGPKSALSKVHLGHDPQLEKAEARAQSAVTLGAIVERYLEDGPAACEHHRAASSSPVAVPVAIELHTRLSAVDIR